jgi:MFS family permease
MCQFVARLFLTAELSIAIIMVGEEFPARLRGRAIAILTSLATAGVIFISKLQPYVLLPPGAETNRVHNLGHGMVTGVQAALDLASDGAAWRSLYALGLLPLAAILLLRLGMRETRRFEAARASARSRRKATWGELWHDVTLPWHREYRRRTAIVALLWNCVYLVTGVSTAFYVIYARGTLKLTPFDVGDIVTWGYVGGIAGSFIGGWLIDRIGRKYTCAGAYVLGALSIYSLYHVTSVPAQYASMILTVLSFAGGLSATHVYASELFPTEIRATGYGWTANLAGRITEVFGPAVIGLFMAKLALSVPDAIAVLSVGPIVGALLVLRYAPETRGLTLEQIQQRLSA